MLRLTGFWLAFVLAAASAPDPDGTEPMDTGPQDAAPSISDPPGQETANPSPEDAGAAATEPLDPIETRNSIKVNANVSLPQDI